MAAASATGLCDRVLCKKCGSVGIGMHALRVGTESPQSQTGRDITAAGTYTVTLEVTLTPVAVTAHSRTEAFWTDAMASRAHNFGL